MTKAKETETFVTVVLRKSGIGYNIKQKRTLIGLGLTKINKTRTLKDTPAIRGMINKVSHLVEVIEPDV
jgi:large subunit ribosomal protein L30